MRRFIVGEYAAMDLNPMRIFLLLMLGACAPQDGPEERTFGTWSPNGGGDASDATPGTSEDEPMVGGLQDDPDGDGYTNEEEQAAGTNPNYKYSHPYTGDYRVGYCSERPDPTGPTKSQSYSDGSISYDYWSYQQGDVAENFTMIDQHNETVDLYSFCGKHIMLVVGAGWCQPCRTEAAELQSIAEAYPDAQIIQILSQDDSYNIPSQSFVTQWANTFGFENVAALGPLSSPTTYEEYFSSAANQFEDDGYIPTIYHLDTDMTVLSADRSVGTPDTWM